MPSVPTSNWANNQITCIHNLSLDFPKENSGVQFIQHHVIPLFSMKKHDYLQI